ncbi:MAG: mucoidy inhibitor MuiA family protein, partial [Firmicutes bacterium]|nr:mucoidy inhibitor MuiA family protein [Bacillota bacterium]
MSKEIIINKSRIIEARLYSAGAQVVREASVEISAGDSKVLFTQLPFDIDPLSVSVMTSGAEMQSADFKINYLTDALVAPKTTDLKKGLKKAEDDLAQTDSKIAVLNFEKEMLDANRTLVGEDAGVKTDELKSAFEYLKNSFEKNRLEFLKLVKLKKEQTETLEKLKKELADNQSRPVPSGEIITEISAQKAGAVKFTLTYYVPKASWEPFYEARGEDNSNKVTLKLKAKIKQNTGELWEGVRIILSTGNPSSAVNQPELMPWYLRPNRPVRAQFQSFNASASMVKEEARMKSDAMGLTDTQVDSCLEYYDAEVVENISGTEFALSGLCSLPSFESKTF